MSKLPNIVYVSSDSSSTDEVDVSEDSSAFSGPTWADYFPKTAPSARKVEFVQPKEGPSTKAPSLEFYSGSSSDDDSDESYDLSKELPKALNTALSTAISNLKKIEVPEKSKKSAKLPKPPKPVLFLPCPKLQSIFESKKYSAHKAKNNYQGKGKKPME